MRLFDRGMGHWDLRASDEDRERVVDMLREHCAAGRLHLDEFSARLDEVYAARTYRELAWTTRELPRLEPRPASSGIGVGRHVLGNGIVTAVWLAAEASFGPYGGLDFPLPLLTMLGSAGILAARAWRQRLQAGRLGGRRHRYEVSAKDRWRPGIQPPPRWLPPAIGRQLPPGRYVPAQQRPRHPQRPPQPPWPSRPAR
jgi:hypothetical protein